ncbi:ATP-binding protein [Treponema sp. Marseille-Q4130]|uniref:ATP-binding protein n=1 Tax=Treponema sp. Marseille-Q4130 TaxID=2766702 RepID=UPI0021030472|nr:ATP-binding protein [Treponema sp. Marseille-Q4130]
MVTGKKIAGTAVIIFFICCTIALSQNARDPKGARPYRGMRMRAVMRRNEAHERSGGGAGLGLAIVKSIMSALGGTVRTESEAGKGCTIVLAVPEAAKET